MEYSFRHLVKSKERLVKHMEGVGLEPTPFDFEDAEALLRILTKIIGELLNRDLERLLQICYRVDLDEQAVKRTLAEERPEAMAGTLAKMMLDRELQKAYFREKYQSDD